MRYACYDDPKGAVPRTHHLFVHHRHLTKWEAGCVVYFLRILVLPPFVLNPCPSCCYTNTQYKYMDCSAMAKESFRIQKGLKLSLLLRRQTRSIDTLVAMSCLSVRSCKQTIPRRVYQKCGTEVAV